MGQVIFADEPPYQALNALGASADAKDRTIVLKFQVAVEDGVTKVLLVRVVPEKALELSRQIVSAATAAAANQSVDS
jgi:hypothetical protein